MEFSSRKKNFSWSYTCSREFKLSEFKLSRFYRISKINKEQDCPGGEGGCFFPWGGWVSVLLIVKWLGFCLHHFWEMTHKPRWECLQSFFCSKGEIKLWDCVKLKHFPKLPDFIRMFLNGGLWYKSLYIFTSVVKSIALFCAKTIWVLQWLPFSKFHTSNLSKEHGILTPCLPSCVRSLRQMKSPRAQSSE